MYHVLYKTRRNHGTTVCVSFFMAIAIVLCVANQLNMPIQIETVTGHATVIDHVYM